MKPKQPRPPDILRKGHAHRDKRREKDRKQTQPPCPRCGGTGYLDADLKQPCPDCNVD